MAEQATTESKGQSSICLHANSDAERQRLTRKARSGTLTRVARGIYAPAEQWEELDDIDRARNLALVLGLVHPNWVFCLFTAAVLYGLEIGRDNAMPLHVQTPRSRETTTSEFVRHPLTCTNPGVVEAVHVTPEVQTVIDCLIELPFQRALAVADSALRVLKLTKKELTSELAKRPSGKAKRIAENVIAYADSCAANGGESVARAVMIEQGFMVPELQVEMNDPLDPSQKHYADFRWRLSSGDVVGELDGRDKYVLPEMTGGRDTLDVVIDERHRESRLTAPGVKVMRFTFRDVMDVGRFVSLLKLYGIPRGVARIMDE